MPILVNSFFLAVTGYVTSFVYFVIVILAKNNNGAVYTNENKARLSLAAGYLSREHPL